MAFSWKDHNSIWKGEGIYFLTFVVAGRRKVLGTLKPVSSCRWYMENVERFSNNNGNLTGRDGNKRPTKGNNNSSIDGSNGNSTTTSSSNTDSSSSNNSSTDGNSTTDTSSNTTTTSSSNTDSSSNTTTNNNSSIDGSNGNNNSCNDGSNGSNVNNRPTDGSNVNNRPSGNGNNHSSSNGNTTNSSTTTSSLPIKDKYGHFVDYDGRGQAINNSSLAVTELSTFGLAVSRELQNLPNRVEGLMVCAKQMMPDHIHVVIWLTKDTGRTIRQIGNGFRIGIKKRAIDLGIWNETDGHILDTPFIRTLTHKGQLKSMINYVHTNPDNAWMKLLNPELYVIRRDIELAGLHFDSMGKERLLAYPDRQVIALSRSLTAEQIKK